MSVSAKPQNFGNHTRFVPGFHVGTGFLVIIILGWTVYRLATLRTADSLLGVLVAFALLGEFWYTRAFPMAVQDRLIRLEERLRLAKLLPADLQARCDTLTPGQLIALRFASDEELPALTKKVLDERITGRKEIKALVVNWRADHMRA